jgi:hypothetical protein
MGSPCLRIRFCLLFIHRRHPSCLISHHRMTEDAVTMKHALKHGGLSSNTTENYFMIFIVNGDQ